MPDAIEMLTADHRAVEELFGRYEASRDPSVVREICTQLSVHAALEERLVYPLLDANVDRGTSMRHHAEEEHQKVKDAIFEIQRVGYDDRGVDGAMATIIKGVKEHVREEESEVLPSLRQSLNAAELASTTEEVRATKAQLLETATKVGPLLDLTKEKLYELAKEKDIPGRSEMTKDKLLTALAQASQRGTPPGGTR